MEGNYDGRALRTRDRGGQKRTQRKTESGGNETETDERREGG